MIGGVFAGTRRNAMPRLVRQEPTNQGHLNKLTDRPRKSSPVQAGALTERDQIMANQPQQLTLPPPRTYTRTDFTALRAFVQRIPASTIARLYYDTEFAP